MTTATLKADTAGSRPAVSWFARRSGSILVLLALLVGLALLSLAIGSNLLPFRDVIAALQGEGTVEARRVVLDQRLPRLVLAIIVGAALAVAGALMQALTRNPLADPGILGVNAGASLAVVTAVAVIGNTSIWFYLWFALAGAALASAAVFILGGAASRHTSPSRLVLAGVAFSMAVTSFVQLVIISDQKVFNEFRFWSAGSLEFRSWSIIGAVILFIVAGLILALWSAPALNALALGDETGAALGINVKALRITVLLSITLLAGAATAAVGPIMFVGLGVPYLVRALVGPDVRWVLPLSLLAGPVFFLVADVLARVVVMPQEIQTGIMTALLGGPVFVAIIQRSTGRLLV
ncbi:FecCD family ABC transporter permease [Corynebacterium cystitidis]|uniref:FecCD family ABC transporter permease n=1 Tax=Corynebacterium cystitidis TaxID=35757 RepID=UPI000ABC295A|nr:iron ABC transporter permease [Corynebacterium cystitidis]